MAFERRSQRNRNCLSCKLNHFLWLTVFTLSFLIVAANNFTSDYRTLMAFKSSTDVAHKLGTWSGENPCSGRWVGVTCSRHARVTRLVLEGLQLSGTISSLMPLDQLRILSLENNALNGSLPNLTSWRYLRFLYVSENEFTGTIPDSISALLRLRRLDLSNNMLSGHIPSSLNLLSRLLTLRLQNNRFSGMIPTLQLADLRDFNVSGNELSGQIPDLLSNFSISSFQGNNGLCGTPLLICDASEPSKPDESNPMVVSSTPSSKPSTPPNVRKVTAKLGIGAVIAIVVGDVAVVVLITCFFLLYYWKKYSQPAASKRSKKMSDSEKLVFSSANYPQQMPDGDGGKLTFVDGRKPFELEHLLRASAEMLGKGTFGTTYKAVLEDGSAVAVKRLKDLSSVGRREFEQHMELVGRLRHPNLVFLRAYYYAKEEKLLVYDFLPSGNLSSLLHGNRGPGRTPVDWTTRLKITLGAARGLAHIHHQCKAQKLPHGNVKSCNVLIDKNGHACLSDFGLVLMASPSVVVSRLVGYRAPEHIETKKVSQRADVYSFGVLLLEILTGKPPSQSRVRGEEGIDLPKWVQSVVQEEWTAEVFDLELLRYKDVEEEMVAMLQIAMSCVAQSPENRPKMSQVVKMIEDIIGDQSLLRADSFDSPSLSSSLSEDTGTSH